MKEIRLRGITIRNFKGCDFLDVAFGDITHITGRNGVGKSTIFDAFCYVLFNKDSRGAADFLKRPVDQDGKFKDERSTIEVLVSLLVDGEPVELIKRECRKYSKNRETGEDEFTGNETSYMINGVSVKQKDYSKFIADIISENDFHLLTDINYFPSLTKAEKRKILITLCGSINNADITSDDGTGDKYADVRAGIATCGEEAYLLSLRKEKKQAEKQQSGIQMMLEQAQVALASGLSVSELEKRQSDITAKVADTQTEISTIKEQTGVFDLMTERDEIQSKIRDIEGKAKRLIDADIEKAHKEILATQAAIGSLDSEIATRKERGRSLVERVKTLEIERASLKKQYDKEKASYFDASRSINCPTCGAPFSKERVEIAVMNFTKAKKKALNALVKAGEANKESMETNTKAIQDTKAEVEVLLQQKAERESELVSLQEALDKLPRDVDLSANGEYTELMRQLADIDAKIASVNEKRKAIDELQESLERLKNELREIDAAIEAKQDQKAKVESLRTQSREAGQGIAKIERLEYLVSDFSRRKSEMISAIVNDHFTKAKFVLFTPKIGGGYTEVCDITYNGVDYGSLNSGHRITVMLDVINAYQKILGITAPIFIDNAECLSSDNEPVLDSQVVFLKVTDGDLGITSQNKETEVGE